MDLNYRINPKNKKYKEIGERSGKIFKGDYYKFINSVKNKHKAEIFILIRKYQSFYL